MRSLAELGYETPTPIQQQAIPAVLAGSDVLASAQTGTGKTAAFALPFLQLLLDNQVGSKGKIVPRVLVLAPTRELAQQISDNVRDYRKFTNLRQATIFGGMPFGRQISELKKGVDVVIGTPGRVMDMMRQGHLKLDAISFFVLDEADRMLDMGFIHDIRTVAKAIPHQPQTLMFSATMPKGIKALADELLTDPVYIEIAPQGTAAETVAQHVFHLRREDKMALLEQVLLEEASGRTLVFTRTKAWADKLVDRLAERGIPSEALHGDVRQNKRLKVLDSFRKGRCQVLVATDVAARGLDVDGIGLVVNYDMPNEPETYVHRIGRTGRAGASGVALSFCDKTERSALKQIEAMIRQEVPVRTGHAFEVDPAAERAASGEGKGGFKGKKKYGSGGGRSFGKSGGGGGGKGFGKPRGEKKSFGGKKRQASFA